MAIIVAFPHIFVNRAEAIRKECQRSKEADQTLNAVIRKYVYV